MGTQGTTFGRDNKTAALASSLVDRLDDVDELLLVRHRPVDLVVVSCAKVDHDVLVSEEEHDGARVVQLVHGIEGGNLRTCHVSNAQQRQEAQASSTGKSRTPATYIEEALQREHDTPSSTCLSKQWLQLRDMRGERTQCMLLQDLKASTAG